MYICDVISINYIYIYIYTYICIYILGVLAAENHEQHAQDKSL